MLVHNHLVLSASWWDTGGLPPPTDLHVTYVVVCVVDWVGFGLGLDWVWTRPITRNILIWMPWPTQSKSNPILTQLASPSTNPVTPHTQERHNRHTRGAGGTHHTPCNQCDRNVRAVRYPTTKLGLVHRHLFSR